MRYLLRQKIYTLINVLGLSIGFIAFVIIFLFIQKENSYDKFHEKAKDMFRLEEKWTSSGEEQHSAASTAYLLPYLIDNYPEVDGGSRFIKAIWTIFIHHGEEKFLEERFCYADSTFFDFFDFKLINGEPNAALNAPYKVVLSEATAIKYFGKENPLGKEILYEGNHVFTVAGVMENMPDNSHFHFDLIFPISFIMRNFSERDKGDNVFYSYIRLNENHNIWGLKDKVNNDLPVIPGYQNKLKQASINCEIVFRPLLDIHLKGNAERELEANGNELFIIVLRIVAFFILLVAGINYSNLATAKSLKRAREIGVRKVLGSGKPAIFLQFMGESFFLCIISLLFSLLLLSLILPLINSLLGTNLSLTLWDNPSLFISLLAAVILLGFLSGAYPALVLSRMHLLKLLKLKSNQQSGKKLRLTFRSSLIIMQFAISVFFIIGSLSINNHLKYLKNKELGFDKEKIIVVPLKGYAVRNTGTLRAIKEELVKTSGIKNVTVSNVIPGERFPFHTVRFPRLAGSAALQSKEPDGSIWMRIMLCDEDIIETLGLTITEGRNFSNAHEDNEHGFIINETAAKFLGLKEPVGEPAEYTFNMEEAQRGQIIGIVNDFNFAPLHSVIEPVVLYVSNRGRFYMLLRTEAIKEDAITSKVKEIWNRFHPDIPFDYYYLDDKYNTLYKAEDTMQRVASIFTFIVIFIAMMGLLGISFYMMEQRKKEIALRKIMGASVTEVLYFISKDFIILVLIGNALAWVPITILLNRWLQNFTYHEGINYWIYVFTILISVFIALVTVSFNVLRTALTNPVKAIKEE